MEDSKDEIKECKAKGAMKEEKEQEIAEVKLREQQKLYFI